ncbi:hypothetical protein ACPA0F_18250 [Solibacillus silvestris]
MIAEEKRQLILDEGVPVEVTDYTGRLLFSTKAIIGKATKQALSEISHEYHRKAHFIPEVAVDNGLVVKNLVTGDNYITMATMTEAYGNEIVTKISRMALTNAFMTVTGLTETADENGDITKGEAVKAANLPVYVEILNAELKQYQPGQQTDAEYVVYCPVMDYAVLDKVVINQGGRNIKVKMQYADFLTFEGLALLHVKTETRV